MRRIYLDYNATTPIAPSVVEAMQPFLTTHFGNPSSDHVLGRVAAQAVDDAREKVANMLGCAAEEVLFTSGGTESNNLALKGRVAHMSRGKPVHLVTTAIEHPAILEPMRYLQSQGHTVTECPCDANGRVSPASIEQALREETVLVSVMHANNEIGTIQPIREIVDICHRQGILVHTDAAQSVGKIRTVVDELGVDMLSIAGHKIYAPKGVGALYVRHGTAISPHLHGAAHERGLRAGTENVPFLVGLGAAARLAARSTEEGENRLTALRDHLQELLVARVAGLNVHGQRAARLPNTLSVSFPGVAGSDLLASVPELCASTGAACHSGDSLMSATLAGIGLTSDQARGTVRLSLGWQTSKDEIDQAADWLASAWEKLVR